jgi:hypothetical protein
MGGLVWVDKIFQACQGPTSFIAYESGWVIFEYSHVFRSGGSLMTFTAERGHNSSIGDQYHCKKYDIQPFICKVVVEWWALYAIV